MSDVRSAVIARRQASAAVLESLATCPPGLTLLIKRVVIDNPGTTTVAVNFFLVDPATGEAAFFIRESAAVGTAVDIETWQVLMPGDEIRWQTSSGGVRVWVSGAVLYGIPVGWTPG